MGGRGSGRYGGGPCVEDCCRLYIDMLIRVGTLRPGHAHTGTWSWHNSLTGEPVGHVLLATHLGEDRVYVAHPHRAGSAAQPEAYVVRLTSVVPRFGGRRWYFVCPLTGRRTSSLFLPRGARRFACRQAYGLAFRSQRLSPRDRALQRYHRLRERLGTDRPTGMHATTYDREREKLARLELVASGFLLKDVQRLETRIAG